MKRVVKVFDYEGRLNEPRQYSQQTSESFLCREGRSICSDACRIKTRLRSSNQGETAY